MAVKERASLLASPRFTIPAAILLRVGLMLFGVWQDEHSPVKYTDIDYYVFTDAARFVAKGSSPYKRDTYRYTPLLAWALLPTAWSTTWFSFGKVLFAASDVVAGCLIIKILHDNQGMKWSRATKYANIWLLNPMVAQISTRGSSEGLLLALIVAMLAAVLSRHIILSGILLGVAVHLKIYPFIYGVAILWWLDDREVSPSVALGDAGRSFSHMLHRLPSAERIRFVAVSGGTFLLLDVIMFQVYGGDFIKHTFLYHFVRSDHRHNFSIYNTVLYLDASPASTSNASIERYAFFPQLLLSVLLLPLSLAKKDLASTMLAQTMAFVAFNKVCTSQYFLWYMVFLPFYLPGSSLIGKVSLGVFALLLWIGGQALWLQQGYQLEFQGKSTFFPQLFMAGLIFFAVNVWLLGIVIVDIRQRRTHLPLPSKIKRG